MILNQNRPAAPLVQHSSHNPHSKSRPLGSKSTRLRGSHCWPPRQKSWYSAKQQRQKVINPSQKQSEVILLKSYKVLVGAAQYWPPPRNSYQTEKQRPSATILPAAGMVRIRLIAAPTSKLPHRIATRRPKVRRNASIRQKRWALKGRNEEAHKNNTPQKRQAWMSGVGTAKRYNKS